MTSKVDKDKLTNECHQIILSRMLKDDDNKYCVDCDAKGPRWASWNLGIFLCIRCAGIHRNLGVHISKVKSVNLDTWTAEQIAMMQEIGNSRGRAVYEANLPDNFRRPQTDTALEQLIRAKYDTKKYIASEWIPPKPNPSVIDEEVAKLDKRLAGTNKGPTLTNTAIARPQPSQNRSTPSQTSLPRPTAATAATPSPRPAVTPSPRPVVTQADTSLPRAISTSAVDDLLGLDTSCGGAPKADPFGDLLGVSGPPPHRSETSPSLQSAAFETLVSEPDPPPKSTKDSILALYAQLGPSNNAFSGQQIPPNNAFSGQQIPPNNAFSTHPGTNSAFSGHPGTNTAFSGHPGTNNAFSGHPGANPAFSGHPGANPSFSGHPGTNNAFSAPGYPTGSDAWSGAQYAPSVSNAYSMMNQYPQQMTAHFQHTQGVHAQQLLGNNQQLFGYNPNQMNANQQQQHQMYANQQQQHQMFPSHPQQHQMFANHQQQQYQQQQQQQDYLSQIQKKLSNIQVGGPSTSDNLQQRITSVDQWQ